MNDRQYKQSLENAVMHKRREPAMLGDILASLGIAGVMAGDESESPIEAALFHFLDRNIAPGVELIQQEWFERRFRVDFVVAKGATRIVIEADGKDYHEAGKDRARDLQIFAMGDVAEIWRLPGAAIRRSVPASLARFYLSRPDWFKPETEAVMRAEGVTVSPDYAPVRTEGKFPTPKPNGGQSAYFGLFQNNPKNRTPLPLQPTRTGTNATSFAPF